MHLIQVLLPRCDNNGQPFEAAIFSDIKRTITDRFGGLTAYNRAPAEGIWTGGGDAVRDDIIIVEVMSEELDVSWWVHFRKLLEQLLKQEQIVIRSHVVDLL